jgi:competence CoiA-like predicted nuclease
MSLDKFITPFIESQFPQFYQEEGPFFIAFIKAYFEWLEQTDNVINRSRSLMEYRDIDTTLDSFVKYFKNKYINALPENIAADKKLLIKYILDLYRSKGTEKSYSLLFKLLFNEDIELYIPGKYVFKLSDNEWVLPKYIEVSNSPFLFDLIGKKIYSSSLNSTAIVENYFTKQVNKKLVNVLSLSNIQGRFKHGEKIL